MAELRKKLTETQVKYLTEAQEALGKARAAYQEAEQTSQKVITLIFDAHGVAPDAVVRFDDQTNELVIPDPVADAKPALVAE